MEFLDEETRPRFLFHSRTPTTVRSPDDQPQPSDHLLKPSLLVSLSLSALAFAISIFSIQSEPTKSLLLWFSVSLFIGPFAPGNVTGGDISVGTGRLVADPDTDAEPPVEKPQFPNRRGKSKRFEDSGKNPGRESGWELEKVANLENQSESGVILVENGRFSGSGKNPVPDSAREPEKDSKEEKEWSEGDVEMLKKLLSKHPVGKPKRWEAISEAFGGAHRVESVIKMAKSMGEKKMNDSDSFARFLKDRKPLDRRVEAEEAEVKEVSSWSGGEDVALLNALKAFPKETAMRWEKIAAAVPGKTKAACMKRVAELKKDFRSSKGSNES